MDKIQKEWDTFGDVEVPLGVLDMFNAARNFLTRYRTLLFISWDFVVQQNGELRESNDPFHITVTNYITVGELGSKRMVVSTK